MHPGGRGNVRHAHDQWVQIRSDRDVTVARRRCPACHARGLVPIFYGMPAGDVLDDLRSGRFVVGGCVITDDDPQQQCIECRSSVYSDGRIEPPGW